MLQALACGKKIHRVIPNFQISINVSYIQIMKSDIISEIAAAIEEFEVNPANVVIELTESDCWNPTRALQACGVL